MALERYSHSAEFIHINNALHDLWKEFVELGKEMESFEPSPISEFKEEKKAELERLKEINPGSSEAGLSDWVDQQIQYKAAPDTQFYNRFDRRHMNQYLTVTMLAHSLCEALINTVLAIGLTEVGATDLFHILEKSDLKKKWVYGPKSFYPQYSFPVGTALNETLVSLIKYRNALIHYKIDLTVGDTKILSGNQIRRSSYDEERLWLRKYFSLPYELGDFVFQNIEKPKVMVLYGRNPVKE